MTSSARFAELRVVRWHDQITGLMNGEPRGPIRCGLDLTNLCNHKCYFCEPEQYRAETVRNRRHTLEADVALRVLDELHAMGCGSLGLSGGGEPLLHPEFGTILSHAKGLGFNIFVNTNGSYIKKWLDVLPLANVVRISLDASNREQHARMHAGKDFEQIIDSMEKLSGKTEVGISYIIDEENSSKADTDWVQEFAKRIGAFVQFKPISLEQHKELKWPEDLAENAFFSEKRHRDVFFQREFSKCYAAFTTTIISATGDVQVCCDRRDLVYGNVYQSSFKNIWQSERHKEVARAIIPKFCQRCLMCDYNRSVEENVINDQAKTWLV